MKPTLILTVGLPQSGKSTWARRSGHPMVERDAIRKSICPTGFLGNPIRYFGEENRVTEIQVLMVHSLFNAGHQMVVISDTNLKQKYRDHWKLIAKANNYAIEYRFFLTPMEVCQDRARLNYPDEPKFPIIIKSMWEMSMKPEGFVNEFPFTIPEKDDPLEIKEPNWLFI